jgi:hypothetical protein
MTDDELPGVVLGALWAEGHLPALRRPRVRDMPTTVPAS